MTEHIYGATSGDTMTPVGEHTAEESRDEVREESRDESADQTRELQDNPQDDSQELFSGDDANLFRERWQHVQSRFVDDPRGAVADADALVSDVTSSLTSRFAEQKTTLEQQWSKGEDVETENLRQTMQRYRTLFERLLAA